jgi:uncharacterized protein YndB with AHSA1/START domain
LPDSPLQKAPSLLLIKHATKKLLFILQQAIVQPNGCFSTTAEESMMSHSIEKQIELKAPLERVWRALTDYREFGVWFQVKLDTPFVAGERTRGKILYPGFENLVWEVQVKTIQPQHLFSFTWHPYAIDPKIDYSKEIPTLVEFRLEQTADGTLLRVIESGFDKIPSHRYIEAMRMNDGGWAEQMENIRKYVAANP